MVQGRAVCVIVISVLIVVGGLDFALTPGHFRAEMVGTDSVAPLAPAAGHPSPATSPFDGVVSAIAFDPANGDVYVAYLDSSNVTIINGETGSILKTLTVGLDPDALAVDGTSGDVYVANSGSANVSVVSGTTNTVSTTVPVGDGPCAIAVDGVDGDVYVANFYSGNVSVLDSSTHLDIGSVAVGASVDSLAVDAANGDIYAGDYAGNYFVTVIDGASNSILTTIPDPGGQPWSLAVDLGNGEIYMPLNNTGEVAVVDGETNQLTSTIAVGSTPRALAVDSVNGDLYVANLYSDNVSVISGQSNLVVATIPVGDFPTAVAVDAGTGYVYVVNQDSNNVTIIDGATNTILRSVPTGSQPSAEVVDSPAGKVFVSDYGSSDVSVIGASPESLYNVSFSETGLRSGTEWSATFDGTVETTLASSITFASITNGTHAYLLQSEGSYRVSGLAPAGSITVHGASLTESVIFVRGMTYSIVLHELGLASGTHWCVTIGSTLCSTTDKVVFKHLTPGTYTYSVLSVGTFTTLVKLAGEAVPASGSNTISHGETFQVRYDSAVTFTESGLPGGTMWKVTAGGSAVTSTSTTIVLYLRNGTYTFAVGHVVGFAASPASGRITESGSPRGESIVFATHGFAPANLTAESDSVRHVSRTILSARVISRFWFKSPNLD